MIGLEGKWVKKSKFNKVLIGIVVYLVLSGLGLNLYWVYLIITSI